MNEYLPIFEELLSYAPFELEELVDREGVLTLVLSGNQDKQRVEMQFDSYFLYRKLAEGDALLTLSAMKRTGGLAKWFYRVNDSDFVAWFKKERCDGKFVQALTHYVVATLDDIVDIVALEAPDIRVKPYYSDRPTD